MIINKDQIQSKINNMVKEEGFDLLESKIFFLNGKHVVRCVVDHVLGGITIDECAKINRVIFSYLYEEQPLGERYSVEINSPGLDWPLKNARDFRKVKGRKISLWFNEPVNDKVFLEGEVLEIEENELILDCKGKTLKIAIDKIKLGKEKL
ncbi:MAG: hypothetical protein KAJ79_02550 [Candidatus Omnitrophica bacterium]|nr:hypothetical protein [Candidatus Omnitrophota bacterium]